MDEAEAMDLRLRICQRQGFECVCGAMVYPMQCQLAHRIPQRKNMMARYGAAVIHHEKNLVAVCSLRCNDSVSISNHPLLIEELVAEIQGAIDEENLGDDHG